MSGRSSRRPPAPLPHPVPVLAPPPRRPLFRIGRPPDPLAWPPLAVVGHERFDDPLGEYRVLYAALQRAACFAETLAGFRPDLASLAAERAIVGTATPPRRAVVPATWWRHRLVGSFRPAPGRWLDLRALGTFQVLRTAFAELAASSGLADVDLSAVSGQLPITGQERRLTQAISRWAFDHGFGGVVYTSRLHQRYQCWAMFEGTPLHPVGPPEPIAPDDPDFVLTARHLGLLIEP